MTQPLYSNAGFEQMLEIRKGATFKIALNVLNEDESPMDITGWTAAATVAPKAPGGGAAVNFAFEEVDGQLVGTLTAVQCNTLVAIDRRMSVPNYRWNCDLKNPAGEIIPYCFGDVIVKSGDATF